MNSICYANGKFVKGRRPKFTSDIINGLPVASGQARCHSISYETIATGVTNALNYFVYYNDLGISQDEDISYFSHVYYQALSFIAGMIVSVYAIPLNGNTLKAYQIYKYQDSGDKDAPLFEFNQTLSAAVLNLRDCVSEKFKNLAESMSTNAGTPDPFNDNFYNNVALYAHELIVALNSVANNLRIGNAKWNSSAQGAFDATEFKITDKGMLLGKSDSIRIANLIHLTLGQHYVVPNTEDGLTFVTALTSDGQPIIYSSDNRASDFVRECHVNPLQLSVIYTNYLSPNCEIKEIELY